MGSHVQYYKACKKVYNVLCGSVDKLRKLFSSDILYYKD